MDTHFYKISCF